MTKTIKHTLIIMIVLLGLAALSITGDYFGVFGLKKYLVLDFAESSFKPIDKDSGAPVLEMRIKCFQKGNENACTQKENATIGIITVRIPVQKLVWRSLLFKTKEELVATNDPQLHMMFIHYNYDNQVETFIIEDLYNNPLSKYSVKMEKKFLETEDE